ncbi:hypothetical protein HO173_000236 [Letharia columbiana]|uniref:Uncharacterized protein n=1 Tax=Letharia columbiana TaxID=112416 RepID=A0A8H6LA62_9LECA|nr:uncharacterized protein HO173_000236 [Letharia columbiana]KAF6241526.1 hypothetical protein HO173_000236 [Letharia columbiana]
MFGNASAMQYREQVCEHDALTASLSSPSRCGDEAWARKGGRKKAKGARTHRIDPSKLRVSPNITNFEPQYLTESYNKKT